MSVQDDRYTGEFANEGPQAGRRAKTGPMGRLGRWLRAGLVPEPGSVDPTLASLFLFPLGKWRVILVGALLGLFIGFGIARVQTPKYVATLILIPNTDDQISNMGGSLSSLGSLSALAGGGGLLSKPERVTPYQQFRAMVTSLDVARELERKQYLPKLFPELWDFQKNDWKPKPHSVLQPLKNVVKDILRIKSYPHPMVEDIVLKVSQDVAVSENDKTSIFSINYANADPRLAAALVSDIYTATENVLLQRERATADARVRAAQEQLAQTTVETSRQALMSALTQFNIKAIQAKVGSPYAVRIISGPEVSDSPIQPSIRNSIVIGFLAGLLATLFILVLTGLYSAWKKSGDLAGRPY